MKKLALIINLIFISSCTINGITNDFGKLSEEQKSIIQKANSFEQLNPNYIYSIDASSLKEELKKNDKSLVYSFANGCSSKYCLPLAVYESFAENNGYKLYLVMVGFSNLNQTLNQKPESQLYCIDYDSYNTKYRNSAVKRFENELRNLPLDYKEKEFQGSLFFFEKDQFIEIRKELPKLQ